jgi:ribosomal protein S18 acetylase RimI-like enzyme
MDEIIIRRATGKDALIIAQLSRETFCESFSQFNTKSDIDKFLSVQFSIEKLVAQVTQSGNIFLLAYVNDTLAGYVFLKDGSHKELNTANAIEIARFYARTAFIGKGIGKALMLAAIALSKELQKDILWLGTWKYNQRAVRFYASFGFEKFGEQDFILGDDIQRDWVMKLELR